MTIFFGNIVVVQNPKQAYTPSHVYASGLDRQWATATSTVVISLMRNQLSHTFGIHVIGLIMCKSYKIALYMGLLIAVNGEILQLPVRVRHIQNAARTMLPTPLYTPLWRITFKTIITYLHG